MKKSSFITIMFLYIACHCFSYNAFATTVSNAEYFFDIDPGQGNGLPMSSNDGSPDTSLENFRKDGISVDSLSEGIHRLYIRGRDSLGQWGASDSVEFRIAGENWSSDYDYPIIIAAEYFFDNDPGQGNALPLFSSDRSPNSALEDFFIQDFSISGLAPGYHKLYVRGKDNNGQWGKIKEFEFEITSPDSDEADSKNYTLASAEYFFDNDPGNGKGVLLIPSDRIFDSKSENISIDNIDVSSLSEGNHRFFIRAMRNDGFWGNPKSMNLKIDRTKPVLTLNNVPSDTKKIWEWSAIDNSSVSFRYIIDGNPLWQTPSGNFSDIKTASESHFGTWYIHVQAKDEAGNLSEIVTNQAIIKNTNIGRAIILAGGMASQQNIYWDVTKKLAVDTYRYFKSVGFSDGMIHFMINSKIIDINYDDIPDNIVDSYTPTVESFIDTIENRFVSELNSETVLFIYMFGHGTEDRRFQVLGVDQMITGAQLDKALDTIQEKTGCKSVVIIESCYSGNFIEDIKDLSRVIVTSVDNERYNVDASGMIVFSKFLFAKLREGDSLQKAFDYTKNEMLKIGHPSPRLDGSFASAVYLGDNLSMWPKPEISDINLTQTYLPQISVKVSPGNYAITKVIAQIIPPKDIMTSSDETAVYPEIELNYDTQTGQYKGILDYMYIKGTYKIAVSAKDAGHEISDVVVKDINAPGVDLNFDRIMDIKDAIMAFMIASNIRIPNYEQYKTIGIYDIIRIMKLISME